MSGDDELVRRCIKGFPEAMRELVDRFQTDVYSLCVRFIGHRHDAEDVTQEVFLRVFRSLHRWDRTRPLRPWISAITVNCCRTWLGKKRRIPEPTEYLAEIADRPVSDSTDELITEIRRAVDELRSDFREVFILFHEVGRSYDEISEIVGRPVGTIKTWLHRGRAHVLAELQKRGFAIEGTANSEAIAKLESRS